MSPSTLDSAEAQWLTQLAAMRAALVDLKLPPKSTNGESTVYGSEFNFDEDDEFTSGNSGDDMWDFISDSEEDVYSSDPNEDTIPDRSANTNIEGYGPQWLTKKCIGFAAKKQGLSGEDLAEQVMALLTSDSVEEELQSTLTDIIGFDGLDFVIEIISHRKEIIAASPFSTDKDEGIFEKLQTKRQREEALRQRDYEHKHATLGPSIDRDGPQYPHVYKAHSAGNTLDSRGRKYALPVGSERKEHEVCKHHSLSSDFLTPKRNMKSTLSLQGKWELLGKAESSSKFPRWMASAEEHSKGTSLLIACKVWSIQLPTRPVRICSYVLLLAL
jgi:antiviral helicase SLH1